MSDKQRHKLIPTSHLILLKENKVLLLRRFNTGYEDGNYSLIAGHVEANETFTQCMIREAEEEAGILLKSEEIKTIHFMHRKSNGEDNERIDAFFLSTQWSGDPQNKEPTKCDDLSWFDLNNLPPNIIPYIRQALESLNNKKFYSECGW